MGLLTFSFYMLSEHPDIEKRLRQEIYDKVGPTGRLTYDQMRQLKYMRAFLNGMYLRFCIDQNLSLIIFMAEVLRLYPPVLVFPSLLSIHVDHVMSAAVRSMPGIYPAVFLPFSLVSWYLGILPRQSFYLPYSVRNQSTSQRKQSLCCYILSFRMIRVIYWLDYSCLYSVLVMHRRTDLWGPDGMMITIFLLNTSGSPIRLSSFSTRIRSWSFFGW